MEQLDKLTNAVFTVSSLRELKQAFVAMLDMFEEVVSGFNDRDISRNAFLAYSELISRIDKIEKERWKKIRLDYLADPYFANIFAPGDNGEPTVILLNLTRMFEEFTKTVRTQIEENILQSKKMQAAMSELSDSLKEKSRELRDVKCQLDTSKGDLLIERSEIEKMREEMRTQRQTISNFQRDSTVQLWQRERERILSQSNDKIRDLEKQLEAMTENRDRTKERLSHNLAMKEEEYKLLKMKSEINKTIPKGGSDFDQQNHNIIYLLEKDILHLEEEIKKIQTVYSALLNGIRRDTKVVSEKSKHLTVGDVLSTDINTLLDRCQTVSNASVNGTISEVRQSLPDHYKILTEPIKFNPVMKVSAYGKSISKTPDEQPKPPEGTNSQTDLKQSHENQIEINSDAVTKSHHRVTFSVQNDKDHRREEERWRLYRRKSIKESNPVLIDSRSGRINSMIALRQFPHISQKTLLEHWNHFSEFDRDVNRELDFCEVVQALQMTVGIVFTVSEIEDVFYEIDVDKSETLDFYEYVLLADRIIQKNGKSDIFKSSMAQKNGSVISKTCAVQ